MYDYVWSRIGGGEVASNFNIKIILNTILIETINELDILYKEEKEMLYIMIKCIF